MFRTKTRIVLFSSIEVSNVVPKGFPEWEQNMNDWADHMFATINSVSELLAICIGLPKNYLVDRMVDSDTLLAPTGIDVLGRSENQIIAGYHYDISFLTIHGKSRYPGLYIWTRDNKKVLVKIPDGCLLIQAGKQLEHITGGNIEAGFHEVVITGQALERAEKASAENRSTWRVSSTMFAHFNNKCVLEVLDQFKDVPNVETKYPKITKGEWLIQELSRINLK